MLRTVADDTPSPAAVTSTDDATGSPEMTNCTYQRSQDASRAVVCFHVVSGWVRVRSN